MEDQEYYRIEKLFNDLMAILTDRLTKSDIDEVNLFLNVGEEGVAMETLIGILIYNGTRITNSAIQIIDELHALMGMQNINREKLINLLDMC